MTILDSAELLLQAKNYSGTGDWLDEANAHDAQLGTGTPGVADPLFKSAGSLQYIFHPGLANNHLNIPDAASLDLTGDYDLIVRVRMADWTPGSSDAFIAKSTGSGSGFGNYQWILNGADNFLRFWWRDTTTGTENVRSDATIPLTDGTIGWLRVTFDIDNEAGGGDITFYTSADQTSDTDLVTWVPLGSVITHGAVTVPLTSTEDVRIGSQGSGTVNVLSADMYRAVIKDGIDGTVILDVVAADATQPYATFTERSSNAHTVTIARAATGLVTTVIDRDWWLYTTDDYHEIADDANLDFAADEDLTTMVMFRTNTVATGSDVLLSKKDDLTTAAGYVLVRNAATGQGIIADGAADDDDTVTTVAVHTLHTLAMVRNTTDDDVEVFLDGISSGSPTTDSTTVTLANALPLRIGATSGTAANFFEGVIGAVVQWPPDTALTAAEVLEAHVRLTQLPAFPPFHRRQNTLVRM